MSKVFILGESGSTKTDWCIADENGRPIGFQTVGINPDVQSDDVILRTLQNDWLPQVGVQRPSQLYYYGAGLRNPENQLRLKEIFRKILPELSTEIHHDLLGSARALCGKNAGIVCILGTGSNSCLFDGEKIIQELGGNGYLFGDEGSGADLGKQLIKLALDNELNSALVQEMEKHSGESLLNIRRSVHQSTKPNVALANWAPFVLNHIQHTEIKNLAKKRFETFFEKTVLRYPNYKALSVGFTGSIAWHFKDLLLEKAQELEIQAGKVLQKPVDALFQYHLKYV